MKPQKCEGLSEDVMEEILLRVPVKSLLKLRCVSKSWCHLIDAKRFVKTHLQNSIKNSSFAHHRIILNTWTGLGQCSLPSLLNEPFTADSITYSEFIHVRVDTIRLVGCCNGLVCILVDRKRFILWNPATKKSRILPDFDNKMEYKSIMKYGFGMDEVENDYKVYEMPWDDYFIAKVDLIGKVYSLTSNSWKVIEEERDESVLPIYGSSTGMGIYARGKLHWYVYYKHEIETFDLNSHVYGVVELPTYSEVKCSWLYSQEYNGRLIAFGAHGQQTEDYELDIWVMKEEEYGVKQKTWHKLVTVPYDDNLLTVAPNGEVLLINTSILKYNSFRYPKIISDAQILESGIYIESLASVDPA